MRLIDADALPSALFQKHVHEGEELEPMLYFEDAMKVVEDAPTIDAITVEWLRKYDDAFDNVLPISSALRAWEEGGIT